MITVSRLYRKKYPVLSGVADLINDTLKDNPDMTLEEFAYVLDELILSETVKILEGIEARQLNGKGAEKNG